MELSLLFPFPFAAFFDGDDDDEFTSDDDFTSLDDDLDDLDSEEESSEGKWNDLGIPDDDDV